jgi:hypothetical protein
MEHDKINGISVHEDEILDDIGLTISKKGWLSCYCNVQENYKDIEICSQVMNSRSAFFLPFVSVFVSATIRMIVVALTTTLVP